MNKKFFRVLVLFFVFTFSLSGQSYKFAWFTDTHIGSPDAEEDLLACVESVNKQKDIEVIFVTGDISEKGSDSELTRAKEILDLLNMPYFIIPGNHDTKWSESACTKFKELWGNDKFYFEKQGVVHIGVNSGIPWRGGGGHISPETLMWLDTVASKVTPTAKVLFFSHHPLDGDVDNWFRATNILRKLDTKILLYGHGHANRYSLQNGYPAVMSRSTLRKGKGWGFTIGEVTPDSVFFSEFRQDTLLSRWAAIGIGNKLVIPQVDSADFLNYGSIVKWKKNLNTETSASLISYENKLYHTSTDGVISCIDDKGTLLWKYETGGTIFSKPVIEDGILAVATYQGELMTIKAETGRVIQSIGTGERITSQLTVFETTFRDEDTKAVLFGTADGKIVAYDLYMLDLIWQNKIAGRMIETQPLVIKGRLIFGSWDNYLYCVDAQSGSLNWKWTENKNFYYSPAACFPAGDESAVYVSTPDKFVSKIDITLGKTVWRKKDFESWESVSLSKDGSRLFVKSVNNKFFIVNAKDGKKVKEFNPGFGLCTVPSVPLESGNSVFFGVKKGIVYEIQNGETARPLFFMGTSRVLNVVEVNKNLFAVTNMDGTIIAFSPGS